MTSLKFLKGNYSNLDTTTVSEGQILVCSDTKEIFIDISDSQRVRIGDFMTISDITTLETLDATNVPSSRLYYVESDNILARSNGQKWVQINKQKTVAELKEMLGLGSMAYLSEVSESNLSTEIVEYKLLPVVSSEDNGKILSVVNGIWTVTTLETTTVYVGEAEPTNEMGEDGDLYLQLDSI